MKKCVFFLLLTLSNLAFAQSFPHVVNYGRYFSVSMNNFSNRMQNCWGFVWMYFREGGSESAHVSAFLHPHQSFYRTYYPLDREKTISHLHPSIFCR